MELIVRHAGSDERVTVRRREEVFEVSVGDRVYRVDVADANHSVRSLLIDGKQYELAVRADGERRYQVSGSGGVDAVEVLDPLTHLAEQSRGGGAGAGPQRVTAYMPGRVAAVLLEEGAAVTAGQGVVVLEAMKMENEICAETDGTLGRIFVEPGQAVEGGDPLFEIG